MMNGKGARRGYSPSARALLRAGAAFGLRPLLRCENMDTERNNDMVTKTTDSKPSAQPATPVEDKPIVGSNSDQLEAAAKYRVQHDP